MATKKAKKTQTDKLDDVSLKVDEIYKILVTGDPENNRPGLVERMRNAESYIDSQKRIIWVLLGAVGIDLVMRLWSLVVAVH